MGVRLTFLGAAGTVTGSCFMLEVGERRFLVDCGMFQGTKTIRALNYAPFPFEPASIDAVFLTHAHIDHAGLIPKLIKHGFKGRIHTTRPSIDLLTFMLPDSGYIQEQDVRDRNRRAAQRGKEIVEPIYTRRDAEASLAFFQPVDYDRWIEPYEGVRLRYWNAGHILGSSSIEIDLDTGDAERPRLRLLFSGDLGPEAKLFHPDPEAPEDLDYVISESTYGARDRGPITLESRRSVLEKEVNEAFKGDGTLLIPAFAVERTQELLLDLLVLSKEGRIKPVPIFLDSPLAIKATDAFIENSESLEGGDRFRELMRSLQLRFTETVDESKALARISGNHIIVAASGMCEAGRIKHHLKRCLWRSDTTVLMVGHQAEGTLGRILLNGVKSVRIHGEDIRVKGSVRSIDAYSGHADATEIMDWIVERRPIRSGIFLVHGEDEGLHGLTERLVGAGFGADFVKRPELDDSFDLLAPTLEYQRPEKRRLDPLENVHFDSHNELTELLLDINDRLDDLADDKARGVLIRRLRRALDDE